MSVRIIFDVDGTIALGGHPYSQCIPYEPAVRLVRELKRGGYYIIFFTARYMKVHGGDRLKAHESGYNELLDWLKLHHVPFDEVHFGKISGDIYVDNLGWRVAPNEQIWERLSDFLEKTYESDDDLPG